MALHLKDSTPELERSVRFMRQTVTNIVACLERSMMCEEDTAWEVAIEGFIDAVAERLVQGEDPKAKAVAIAGRLGQRVGDYIAQDQEFRTLERALAGGPT